MGNVFGPPSVYLDCDGFVVFSSCAILSIKNSWKGYKFSPYQLIILSSVMSLFLGTLLFISGGSQRLENVFELAVVNYRSIEERKTTIWTDPTNGLLSGTIESLEDQSFSLLDFNGNIWEIYFEDAFVAPSVFLEIG